MPNYIDVQLKIYDGSTWEPFYPLTRWDNIVDAPSIPSSDSDLTNNRYVRFDTNAQGLTSTQKSNARTNIGAGTSNFSGSYNDLTNKPTIPTKTSDLINDSGFITGVSWSDVTGKPSFATVATSGSYNDLLNKPTIPTAVSDLTNDLGFVEGSDLKVILDDYATLGDLSSEITGLQTYVSTNYLPLTGGTIYNSNSSEPLKIKSNAGSSWVEFVNSSGTTIGFLGVNASKKPAFFDTSSHQLAYVSDLDSYLPLSGGTLTGDLTMNTSKKIKLSGAGINIGAASSQPSYVAGDVSRYNNRLYLGTDGTSGGTKGIAFLSDIPSLSGYATQTWVQNNYLPLTGGILTGALALSGTSRGMLYIYNGDTALGWYSAKLVDGVSRPLYGYTDLEYDLALVTDIPTETTVSGWGFTKNAGTVTSVRVQAGTGLSSSSSTAQTVSLNTTISIAEGYKLPTTNEWNSKVNADDLKTILEDYATLGDVQDYVYDMATQTWVGLNYLPLTGGILTGNTRINIQNDTYLSSDTIPGKTVGNIHIATNQYGTGSLITTGTLASLTFGTFASDNAQAGIYVTTSGAYGTIMLFGTTDSYAQGSKTRMMINANGNVGIGTITPGYLLTVNGTAYATSFNENGTALSNKYLALSGGTLTGKLTLSSAGLSVNATDGYDVDSHGNFIHKSTGGNTNYFHLDNAASTKQLKYYWETGILNVPDGLTVGGTNVSLDGHTHSYLPLSGGTINAGGSKAPLIVKGGLGSYREGIRIIPSGNWSDIVLGGNDITEASGTSANSWAVLNNNGTFFIARNGSDYLANKVITNSDRWYIKDSTTDTPLTIQSGYSNTYLEFKNSSGASLGYYYVSSDHKPGFYYNRTSHPLAYVSDLNSYLPLSGGTLTGNLTIKSPSAGQDAGYLFLQSSNGIEMGHLTSRTDSNTGNAIPVWGFTDAAWDISLAGHTHDSIKAGSANPSAPASGSINFCVCTQSQYNSYTKNANTIYFIVG